VALYLPPGITMDQYLLPPYSTDEIVRTAIFQSEILIGNLVMIYRMYHIYDRSLLACAVPSVATIGLLAINCGLTNQLRSLKSPADSKSLDDWSAACFSLTVFNNVFMSAAISLRLWKVHQETIVSDVTMKYSIILRAMRALVESAVLWTLIVSIGFFSFLAKSNLRYTFLYMTSPVIGISFCLIIVRLWAVTPEVHEESWGSFRRSRASRILSASNSRFTGLPVSLGRVKADRGAYVGDAESDAMELGMMSPISPGEKRPPSLRVG